MAAASEGGLAAEVLRVHAWMCGTVMELDAWPELTVGGLSQRLLSHCGMHCDPACLELFLLDGTRLCPPQQRLSSVRADGDEPVLLLRAELSRHMAESSAPEPSGQPLHTVSDAAALLHEALGGWAGCCKAALRQEATELLTLMPITLSSWEDALVHGLLKLAVRFMVDLGSYSNEALSASCSHHHSQHDNHRSCQPQLLHQQQEAVLAACRALLRLPRGLGANGLACWAACVLEAHTCAQAYRAAAGAPSRPLLQQLQRLLQAEAQEVVDEVCRYGSELAAALAPGELGPQLRRELLLALEPFAADELAMAATRMLDGLWKWHAGNEPPVVLPDPSSHRSLLDVMMGLADGGHGYGRMQLDMPQLSAGMAALLQAHTGGHAVGGCLAAARNAQQAAEAEGVELERPHECRCALSQLPPALDWARCLCNLLDSAYSVYTMTGRRGAPPSPEAMSVADGGTDADAEAGADADADADAGPGPNSAGTRAVLQAGAGPGPSRSSAGPRLSEDGFGAGASSASSSGAATPARTSSSGLSDGSSAPPSNRSSNSGLTGSSIPYVGDIPGSDGLEYFPGSSGGSSSSSSSSTVGGAGSSRPAIATVEIGVGPEPPTSSANAVDALIALRSASASSGAGAGTRVVCTSVGISTSTSSMGGTAEAGSQSMPMAEPAHAALNAHHLLLDSIAAAVQHPCIVSRLAGGGSIAARLAAAELTRLPLWRDPHLATCAPAEAYQQHVLARVFPQVSYVYEDDDYDAPLLVVARDDLLPSSVAELMQYDAAALDVDGICVQFANEQAFGDGVLREWLTEVAGSLFDPSLGLFRLCEGDQRALHISAAGWHQLELMRFAGRIIGLSMRAHVPLGVHLSSALYKLLLRPGDVEQLTLADLQQLDPQVAATCKRLLAEPGAEDLGLTFVGSVGGLGTVHEVPLMPGGEDVVVTDANKGRYVARLTALYCTWGLSTRHREPGSSPASLVYAWLGDERRARWPACLGGRFDMVEALAQGLADVVICREYSTLALAELLAPACLQQFNRRLGGQLGAMDVADWRARTVTTGFASPQEKAVLEMFWCVVGGLDKEDQRRLLQFWTGLKHLCAGGFKHLSQQLALLPLPSSSLGVLQSRTCFFQLMLPLVEDEERMEDAVLVALANMGAFVDE